MRPVNAKFLACASRWYFTDRCSECAVQLGRVNKTMKSTRSDSIVVWPEPIRSTQVFFRTYHRASIDAFESIDDGEPT
jgi:hypothetical protein